MVSDQMDSAYLEMDDNFSTSMNEASSSHLSPHEIQQLRHLLASHVGEDDQSVADSEYTAFAESTHAWAVFADDPGKRASKLDRLVGTMIIIFQLFTYGMFAFEAIEDYQKGQVPVMTAHADCLMANEQPQDNFTCEAEYTNHFDALVAYFMLGIFLTSDFLQAGRAIQRAPSGSALIFAWLAGIEVCAAFISASVSVSYSLYIGEVTDAVEVGVGLLFIRELSSKTYSAIHNKGKKEYKIFFVVLTVLVFVGFCLDPLCEFLFAAPVY